MTTSRAFADAMAAAERDLETMAPEAVRLGAVGMSVRVAVNEAARIDVLVERTRPHREAPFGPPTVRCRAWAPGRGGHPAGGRVLIRATTGLQRPRPTGQADVAIVPNVQALLDQINAATA